MSNGERAIVCRRCREEVPATGDNCPHCGASLRGNVALTGLLLVGLVLVVSALFAPSDLLFFGVIGLGAVAISGYLLYDKRNRIRQAGEDRKEDDSR